MPMLPWHDLCHTTLLLSSMPSFIFALCSTFSLALALVMVSSHVAGCLHERRVTHHPALAAARGATKVRDVVALAEYARASMRDAAETGE